MTRVGFFSGEDFVCCEPHMRAEKWWCIVVIFLDNVNLNSLLLRLKFNISLYFFVFDFFFGDKRPKSLYFVPCSDDIAACKGIENLVFDHMRVFIVT